MATKVQGLTEYCGIADTLPELQSTASFKQITIQESMILPAAKPNIEQIVRVMAEVVIIDVKVIQTPSGNSMEGQKLTGYKAVVEGEIIQKIEYVASDTVQSVHGAHFNVLFSNFIVLPPDFKFGTPVTVTPYIEDIYAMQMSPRNVFKNVTILLVAEF